MRIGEWSGKIYNKIRVFKYLLAQNRENYEKTEKSCVFLEDLLKNIQTKINKTHTKYQFFKKNLEKFQWFW